MSSTPNNKLHLLAFDNTAQANIISIAGSGQIIIANAAACVLLGYSLKELLTKSRAAIFDTRESNFKKMLKQRNAAGRSSALITVIKKDGSSIACEITSAVFMDDDGIEKAITSITDMSQSILKQKKIDKRKEKIVAANIVLAKSVQKEIDSKNEQVVAENIILAKYEQKVIDSKKEKIVADNIVIAKSHQKNIDAEKDKMIADNIMQAKSKQYNIDVKKDKTVANNIIMAQAESNALQAENSEWKKHSGKTSYDVIWDWDIVTGQIYAGDSIEEIFGYKIQNSVMSFKDFTGCLIPVEKRAVEKKLLKVLASGNKVWNDNFMLIRHDGSIAYTTIRANIIRNETGKAIRLIGALQDVSKEHELEKKLKEQIAIQREQSEILPVASNISFDGIWDWNLLTNEFFLGEGFEELFGYAIYKNKGNITDDWLNHIYIDDKEAVEKELAEVLASSSCHWEYDYRFNREDGSVAEVFNRASIIRNAAGKAYRMIGAMQDITKQKVLEAKLEAEIELKEKQIAEAMEEAKYTERSEIGQELHDNINQLLFASRMYLEMSKRGGEKSDIYLNRSSEYTLMAIEEIRILTKGLTTDIIKSLGLSGALDTITRDIMEANPVTITTALVGFNEHSMTDKFKLNIYRIVQEQLNNILKHAQATNVAIRLSLSKKYILLNISDDGVGFDTAKKRNGIGMTNIESRAATYNGTAFFVSQPGCGCMLTVKFPAITQKDSPINQLSYFKKKGPEILNAN